MFYHTPDVRSFVDVIIKQRRFIVAFFLLFQTTLILFFNPMLVSSEEVFWLDASKAYEKTQEKSYQTKNLSRLTVSIDEFNQESLDRLYDLQTRLKANVDVLDVNSLLDMKKIYNDDNHKGSSLVKASSFSSLNAKQISKIFQVSSENYRHYVDKNLTKFHMYIYSSSSIDISTFDIDFKYEYSHPNDRASIMDYFIYIFSIIISIVVLFRYLFRNYFSALIALLIIWITLVTTMSLTAVITGTDAFHISMALIVVAVSLVDYLYFYYRWHVSQYQADVNRAMCRTINRNIAPALWTTFITFMGLGALLFVDSMLVQHLSVSVILASSITYLLNITLLPALLSYYKVKHPRIGFAKLGYAFIKLELHFNRKFFHAFMLVSSLIMMFGLFHTSSHVNELFENSKQSGVITARLPLYDFDYSLMTRMLKFEEAVDIKFSSLVHVGSLAKIISALHESTYNEALTQEGFLEAKMFLELYGLDLGYIDDKSMKIVFSFDPKLTSQSEVLLWLEKQELLDIYLTDVDSLMSHAKSEASLILAGSLITALLLIGLIMGRIFRSKLMILLAFAINSLPMIWFGLVLYILEMPLNIEALIAMTIALALGSDATVHFAYKYFRSRYFGRSLKHSLEKMFFYTGIPVVIGSIILMMVFISLIFTSVHSLQLIGIYGAILILFSLTVDLFVLPVMLIAFDGYFKQRGDPKMLYIHGDSQDSFPAEMVDELDDGK